MFLGNRPNLSSNGPPRWIPFGKPISQTTKTDEPFNSMAEAQTKIAAEENNTEFDSQRNDAISEAIKTENKKVFGGGTKQLQDANVQKIMEKGYSEEQAKTALRYNKNNVEQALNNLRKREERNKGSSDMFNSKSTTPPRKGGKGPADRHEKSEVPSKPSTKISLFDFVEDKLPDDANQSKPNTGSTQQDYGAHYNSTNRRNEQNHNSYSDGSKTSRGQNRFENNISASFASRNQSSNSGQQSSGSQHSQQGSNNYYNANRQERNDNRGMNQGYQGRRQNDYNNTGRGPGGSGGGGRYDSNRDNRDKRYEQRDNYNAQPQHGHQNNRYQKDYNNQPQKHDFQQQPQSHQQKNDYRNDHRNDQKYERNDDRSNQNYLQSSNMSKNNSGGYQRGGQNYNNPNRDSGRNEKDRSTQSGGSSYDYQSGTKTHHQSHQSSGARQQNDYYDKSRSAKPYQQSQYSKPEHQQRRSPPYQSGNQQSSNMNTKQHMSKQPYNKPNTAGNQQQINQITEGTANMKLNTSTVPSAQASQPPIISVANAKVSHHVKNAPQPTAAPQTPVNKNFVQLPNGNYNPYQIMGFQNKATNEFAMNVLKTQQMPAASGAPPPQQVAVPVVPISVPCTVQGPIPAGQFAVQSFVPGPPQTVITSQQPHNQFLPPGATAVFPMSAIPLIKWTVGDLCMAKYWEDGRVSNEKKCYTLSEKI